MNIYEKELRHLEVQIEHLQKTREHQDDDTLDYLLFRQKYCNAMSKVTQLRGKAYELEQEAIQLKNRYKMEKGI